MAELTWVPAEQIREAARMFARSRPACLWNGNANDDTFNSTQCARAFAIMQAICGNLDVPGGTCEARGAILHEGTGHDIRRHLLPPEQEAQEAGRRRRLPSRRPSCGTRSCASRSRCARITC